MKNILQSTRVLIFRRKIEFLSRPWLIFSFNTTTTATTTTMTSTTTTTPEKQKRTKKPKAHVTSQRATTAFEGHNDQEERQKRRTQAPNIDTNNNNNTNTTNLQSFGHVEQLAQEHEYVPPLRTPLACLRVVQKQKDVPHVVRVLQAGADIAHTRAEGQNNETEILGNQKKKHGDEKGVRSSKGRQKTSHGRRTAVAKCPVRGGRDLLWGTRRDNRL